MRKLVYLIVVVVSALSASMAMAQENLRVPTCRDINGQDVRFVAIADPSHGPAFSMNYQGYPTIFVNWAQMKKYASSVDTQRFIFEHECGHCKLGHIYQTNSDLSGDPRRLSKKNNNQELAADCYAAHQIRALGIDLRAVEKDVSLLPRDPDHPAGPVRSANIQKCYNLR